MCRCFGWFALFCLVCSAGFFDVQGQEPATASKTWRRIARQGHFTVSLDADNLPYSARTGKPPGIEVELAHALAKQFGLTAKIDWITARGGTPLARLLEGDCDLVIGLPVDGRLRSDDEAAARRILYTRGYCRGGCLIFVRTGGPRIRIAGLNVGQSQRLGTQAGTLADFRLKEWGFQHKRYGTQSAALKALAGGKIDYAYLWSSAAWPARPAGKLGIEVVQPYELEDWREMAVAVRRGNAGLRQKLDGAVARLVEEGFIERLLQRYGMPYYPSIEHENVTKRAAPNGLPANPISPGRSQP